MRKLVVLVSALALSGLAFGQQYGRPVRFKVMHADPWMIKGILEGQVILSPELSTALSFMGAPPQAGNALNGLFKDGKFVVNATDNSLWWFPEIKS